MNKRLEGISIELNLPKKKLLLCRSCNFISQYLNILLSQYFKKFYLVEIDLLKIDLLTICKEYFVYRISLMRKTKAKYFHISMNIVVDIYSLS